MKYYVAEVYDPSKNVTYKLDFNKECNRVTPFTPNGHAIKFTREQNEESEVLAVIPMAHLVSVTLEDEEKQKVTGIVTVPMDAREWDGFTYVLRNGKYVLKNRN